MGTLRTELEAAIKATDNAGKDNAGKNKPPREQNRRTFNGKATGGDESERVVDALQYVRGWDDYNEWIRIGMALKAWGNATGFSLWCDWSSQYANYDQAECKAKWESFKKDGVGIGTIFHLAKANGWRPASKNDDAKKTKDAATSEPEGDAPPEQNDCSDETPVDDTDLTVVEIIQDEFRKTYRPVFKHGTQIHCKDGSDVPMTVAVKLSTTRMLDRIAKATDAPKYADGNVKRGSLPASFRTWASTAWGDLLATLPDEDQADLGTEAPARDQFRQLVREALFSGLTLGVAQVANGVTHAERRSLVSWAQQFAKPGPWRDIRSMCIWCKLVDHDGELLLHLAVRHELFAQIAADKRLRELGPKRFARLAARYDVGKADENDRPHGVRALVLNREFVADLTSGLPNETFSEATGGKV